MNVKELNVETETMDIARRMKRGFTLVELLVVITIIVVLISILLPSLGQARKLARTAACAANLRSITQSMATYAAEWDNAILGNAHTSSSGLYSSLTAPTIAPGISNANLPGVLSSNDWMSPTAKQMGLSFDEGPNIASQLSRFATFNAFKGFLCPDNDILATSYTGNGGLNAPVHHLISYNTALCFQYDKNPSFSSNATTNQISIPGSFTGLNLGSYKPKTTLVGNSSDKVYIADGARFYSGSGALAYDDNFSISDTSPGGLTSDYGPFDSSNRAYQKGTSASTDGRVASMRHGSRVGGGTFASFKFNLAFFDGHVATMNGLDGANPSLWVPTGGSVSGTESIAGSVPEFNKRYSATPAIN